MPTKAERREITARVIHGYFRDSVEAMTERIKVREDAYRRTDPSYVPETVPHPRIKTPYLFAVKNTKLSWLIRALKANGQWVHLQATTPEYEAAAQAVGAAVNAQFRNRPLNNEPSLISAFDQGFKYGDHYALVRWYEDGAGHWGCQIVNLNINDVFPDPYEQRYYILRRFITVNELMRMAETLSAPRMVKAVDPLTGQEVEIPEMDADGNPVYADGGVAIKAVKSVLRAIEEGTMFQRYGWYWTEHKNSLPSKFGRVTATDDLSGGGGYAEAQDDPFNARVCLLEYHETAANGIVAKIIPDHPTLAAGEDLTFQEPTPQPYGKCQVQRWAPYPVDDEAFAYSLSEIVGGQAEVYDYSIRASVRRVQRWSDPNIVHRRGAKIKPLYLRSPSNVAIDVEDIDRDIRIMDPPSGGDMHYLTHQLMRAGMDLGTGESEQRRGQVGGASSATEAAIAEQAGSASDFLVATRAFLFIEEIADLMVRILRVHITEEKAVPFLGERTAKLVTLKSEYLKHNYWISVGGSVLGGNPALRLQSLLNLYGQTANTGQWDTRSVIEYGLREIGYSNSDSFLMVKRGPEPLPPELEHKMLYAKQELRVSPRENFVDHIQKHMGERYALENGARYADADDYARLVAHIGETIAAYQMAQAMAMQGGGEREQGGAQPFMPHEAGQPGQPATYNGRTADVNQQRQAPNEGTAPQPDVAPNRPTWARRTEGAA